MNHPVVRSIVGVFAGLVVCVILIGVIEYAACAVHPAPKGFDFSDREQLRAHVENAPLSALLLVLAAYAVGTFVGAYMAARVAGRAPLVHAAIVVAPFFVGSVMNLRAMPWLPVWFAVVNLVMFAPIAWLAAWLARPRVEQARPAVVASK
jgi:hypothetical protein